MALVINTNIASLHAQRYFGNNVSELNKSMARLASGYRINMAADDAAGLQISEGLRTQIRGSKRALSNAEDGMNVLAVAEGALSVIGDNLQRIRELAVQAANDTYDANARAAVQTEVNALVSDIERIADSTRFNGLTLLDGSLDGAGNFFLQVGPNSTVADVIDAGASGAFQDSQTAALGIAAGNLFMDTHVNAQAAITDVDAALDLINDQRSNIGAIQNQLQSAMDNLQVGIENFSAAESRIRDVDVASEASNMIRYQILQSSSANVLQQAAQAPSIALQLLQGLG